MERTLVGTKFFLPDAKRRLLLRPSHGTWVAIISDSPPERTFNLLKDGCAAQATRSAGESNYALTTISMAENITAHLVPNGGTNEVRQSRSNNWCFTLNNYNDESQQKVRDLGAGAEYLVFGRELGDSGTPHLQGFIRFRNRLRFDQVAKLVPGAHLSVARNVQKAAEYCRKDGDFEEFGALPVRGQGKRSDLDDFKKACRENEISKVEDIRENYSELYMKFPKFCIEYWEQHLPKNELTRYPLREWQQVLYNDLERQVDPRKIIFIVDLTGNTGKSWFCDYVRLTKEAVQILTPGRKIDMAYEFHCSTKILFMDAPRSKQSDFLLYDFLEDLKNGRLFSTKYESRMKYFNAPHVVVMMNEHPDMTKLSADRYDVRVI